MDLKLVATGDVLKAVRGSSPGLFVVGFAATFGDPLDDAREKLESKGRGPHGGQRHLAFGLGVRVRRDEVHLVGKGGERFVPRASKRRWLARFWTLWAREIGDKER
jgi:phosphopantothenoylcysteine decarboxylase/phosphopantothenate--cysteine ligase